MSKKNLELKLYSFLSIDGKDRWAYDIVDLDDCVHTHGVELPELIAESAQSWSQEESARRNGLKHLKQLEKCK